MKLQVFADQFRASLRDFGLKAVVLHEVPDELILDLFDGEHEEVDIDGSGSSVLSLKQRGETITVNDREMSSPQAAYEWLLSAAIGESAVPV